MKDFDKASKHEGVYNLGPRKNIHKNIRFNMNQKTKNHDKV